MVIAVCSKQEVEYQAIADAIRSYPKREQYVMISRWFPSVAEYRDTHLKHPFAVTIFAFDDIDNQSFRTSGCSLHWECTATVISMI